MKDKVKILLKPKKSGFIEKINVTDTFLEGLLKKIKKKAHYAVLGMEKT